MPQLNYQYPRGITGQPGTYQTGDVTSIANPLNAQVDQYDQNADATDGLWTIQAVSGDQTVSASFTSLAMASGVIAQGIRDAIAADPAFAGVANVDAPVGDVFNITFTQPGKVWVVTMTSDPSAGVVTITNTTAAGFIEVAPGIILQSNTTGGFTTTYTNGILSYGVTLRNADLVQPLNNPQASIGYDGPTMISIVRTGEVYVTVDGGVTVSKGDPVLFNPTTREWTNVVTAAFVAVPGALWTTTGGTVQRVYVDFPTET